MTLPSDETPARPVRVVAVAASAGGVEALQRFVAALPADLDAAVCVVLHIPATGRSLLAPILARHTPLPVAVARDGQALTAGTIVIAPADRHLLVRHGVVELSSGPKENGVRPAADATFRSLARSWGAKAIGVVLSGALDDGSAGAATLAAAGATVIVQDPREALVPGMPESALAAVPDAHVAGLDDLGTLLVGLVRDAAEAAKGNEPLSPDPDPDPLHEPPRPEGPPSGFTCPECHGSLWELEDGGVRRYRCRVGHAYSEGAMLAAQGESVEAALWSALEILEERGELLERMAGRVASAPRSADRFRAAAREAGDRAALIRKALATSAAAAALSAHEDEAPAA